MFSTRYFEAGSRCVFNRSAHALTFETWRDAVRPLLAAGKKAEDLAWPELPWAELAAVDRPVGSAAASSAGARMRLPRTLMSLLDTLACFRDDGRWELMYRLAWRVLYENPRLLEDSADRDVANATAMERAVRRDLHKMHAFVRFREAARAGEETSYFAWFEPQHEILRKGAAFFVKRFPNMPWSIATPDGAAVWDMASLRFIDTDSLGERPQSDSQEELWRTYYRSICNSARLNSPAMQREMPKFYWHNLPEAAEISGLLREGAARFAAEQQPGDHARLSSAKAVHRALVDVRAPVDGLQACRACELWRRATQAVAGEGPAQATVMLVGEQPGDEEDLRGAAFVGPAGKVLDGVLAAAGLDRAGLYITNAVKHFKWEPRGKRRLHKRPSVSEIRACNPWLRQEIAAVKPRVILALGASALTALLEQTLSIEAARHMDLRHAGGAAILATYHPSAILRAEDHERKDMLRAHLIDALQRAAALVAQ